MSRRPLILVSHSVAVKGAEFADVSVSLSTHYERALIRAGLLPWPVLSIGTPELMAECVRRADGVLLTGGEDVEPELKKPKFRRGSGGKGFLPPTADQADRLDISLVV